LPLFILFFSFIVYFIHDRIRGIDDVVLIVGLLRLYCIAKTRPAS